jgi:hypothetical protein
MDKMQMDMMMRYCTSFPYKIIKIDRFSKTNLQFNIMKQNGTNGAYDDPQTPIGTARTYNEV